MRFGEVYLLLLLCGLGDALTTFVGLSVGLGFETRVLGVVPFLSTLIFSGAVWVIRLLPGYDSVKDAVCFFLVLIAFSGAANNLLVLLGVQSLTLF